METTARRDVASRITTNHIYEKNHFPNPYRVDGEVAYIGLTDRRGNVVAETAVDSDFVRAALHSRRWRLKDNGKYVYGSRYRLFERKKGKSLARMVMQAQSGDTVHHKDGNPLNNRKENLYIVKRRAKVNAI
jgi:hypothetical protein